MKDVVVLWTKFTDLSWWQMLLWVAYLIYFVVRSWHFWDETRDSVWEGYKKVMFGYREKYFRVYHIFRIIFDIPPSIIGLFFPILRKVLSYKIYEFKSEEVAK